MDLVLVRHARAQDRDKFARDGKSDDLRPLTREGVQRFGDALPALVRLAPDMEMILSSPWVRAWQTAGMLAGQCGLKPEKLDALIPPVDFDALCSELNRIDAGVVALVGHEPDLGELGCRFLGGERDSFMPLKKGGACRLHFEGNVGQGRATLKWLLTPAQLRMMAGKG